MQPVVVHQRVSVRDSVAQPGRRTHPLGEVPIDHRAICQNVEAARCIVGWCPSFVGHPMRGDVDALLNRQEQVERGEITLLGVGDKLLPGPAEEGSGVIQPGCRPG